ncbi:MAG: hypothetical protein KF854_00645 [Nitrospira sp.]|nr:hypothetical protein [Nitrospira sp.]MBX3513156.1 hypothetical protein [Xanthobacteraceae bacterium]MCW5675401.1 hypothetical protein [Xanthobacteraceae bacterium]
MASVLAASCAAEKARLAKEKAEQRAKEEARRHRIEQRQKFLRGEARKFSAHQRLLQLNTRFAELANKNGSEPVDQIFRVLNEMVREGEERYGRDVMNAEIARLGLISIDDSL